MDYASLAQCDCLCGTQSRAPQQKNFRSHIAAARSLRLPVIVHTRDADDDTIAILEDEMGKGAFTGVIHCFTGTQMLADAALEMGFCISVSGIATFKKSEELRAVLKTVPLDRLLVETDAPLCQVALDSGFGDQSTFSRYFRRNFGVTPRSFRRARR